MQVIKRWYYDIKVVTFGKGSEKVTRQIAQPLDP
jgi:hypothetical protein